MANDFFRLLQQWEPSRHQGQWVLGTVYATEGPSYRKAGAMMLFGDQGQQLGLLSGGCLEADMHRRARQVMDSGQAALLCYDGNDEDDISFQLGIGCGGLVRILLQPLTASNDYLCLPRVLEVLKRRGKGLYRQPVVTGGNPVNSFTETDLALPHFRRHGALVSHQGEQWFETPIQRPPHLLVVGGGVDARPLVAMAHQLGWEVTVWDSRPANARPEHFPFADTLLRMPAMELGPWSRQTGIQGAVVMTHNLQLDSAVLAALQATPLDYLALIGPRHRKVQVMEMAGCGEADFAVPLASPAGLDLGGELPESIALSILAECHGVLAGRSATSLGLAGGLPNG